MIVLAFSETPMSTPRISPTAVEALAPWNAMNVRSPVSREVAHTTLQVLFIVMLIGTVAWILRPFLTSIIWATTIVVATWPVLLVLQSRLWGKRWLAVAAMTVLLLLVIVVPFSLAVASIVSRSENISSWVRSLAAFTLPQPPEWLGAIPILGPKLVDFWRQMAVLKPEELSALLSPYALKIVNWFVTKAGSLGMMVLQFLLTVFISAILYARGETAAAWVLGFTRRLAGQQGENAAVLAAKAIRSVALGVVVTAIMQTALGGIGLAVAGVPVAALLTAVMFIFCLAQVGPWIVLVPAVIWVYWKDGALWGSVLLFFSVLAVTLDNFVRPVLIRKGADLPLILIFAGVIGGLVAFGIVGLFIGPVALAVAYMLLKAWIFVDAPGNASVKPSKERVEGVGT
jgi:predicted PurR-regulated permease PerM